MSQKIFKTGNSLAVTIPANFVRSVGIRPGDSVKTNVKIEDGELLFIFSGAKQLTFLDTISIKREKKRKTIASGQET